MVARRPQRARRGVQTVTTASVSAPVGGINAIDPIAAMKPEDAMFLSNWWVTPYDCQIRQGWMQWGLDTEGEVQSLAAYNTPTGVNQLFAATASDIWDVTTQGPAVSVVTDLTSGRWQDTNYATAGGTFLYLFNGVDKPLLYDGTDWTAIDGSSTPAITGVTTTTLVAGVIHKKRLWLVQTGSLQVYYLDVESIGGAASAFDLRAQFKRGGYIMAATNWTIDAGAGMDDHLVFITNHGEVAVYKGLDPASADTWSLVGIWQLGEPLGRRCFMQHGGDVVYLSKNGVELLSKALVSTGVTTGKALSARIQSLISADAAAFGAVDGWEAALSASLNMLLVNVPTHTGLAHQYAMNTISKSWTRFDAINARCWALFDGALYFGHAGGVGRFWHGWADNQDVNGDNGEAIAYDALQSFQHFGHRAQLKRFTMVRPILQSSGLPALRFVVNTDFNPTVPQGVPNFGNVESPAQWGSAIWNAFKWAGGKYLLSEWQSANALGYSAALFLRGASSGLEVRWASVDYAFERGGVM